MSQPRFQLVPGSRLGAGSGVGWRLLGANNRELGRSAGNFPDAESALDAISEIRQTVRVHEAHVLHDAHSGLWWWRMGGPGAEVAAAGRGFRHERECRYNLEQFRDTAPAAPTAQTNVPDEFPWQRTAASLSAQIEGAS